MAFQIEAYLRLKEEVGIKWVISQLEVSDRYSTDLNNNSNVYSIMLPSLLFFTPAFFEHIRVSPWFWVVWKSVGYHGGFSWSVPESSDGTQWVEFPWSQLPVHHPACIGTMTMFKAIIKIVSQVSSRAPHTTILISESSIASHTCPHSQGPKLHVIISDHVRGL